MMVRSTKLVVALCLVGLLAIPAFANSGGPPYLNSDNQETAKYGCTCHYSSPGDRAVVMASGIPVMYEPDQSYEFVITVADSVTLAGADGNTKAGSSSPITAPEISLGMTLRKSEKLMAIQMRFHSETGDGVWTISWTAPSSDSGTILFSIAGNSVNGDGIPNEYDYWNILTFSINPPGSIAAGDGDATLQTRTIAVGDYQTLFVLEESEAEKEKERQKNLLIEYLKVAICFIGPLLQH